MYTILDLRNIDLGVDVGYEAKEPIYFTSDFKTDAYQVRHTFTSIHASVAIIFSI